VKEKGAGNTTPFLRLLPSIEDQIYGDVEPSKRLSEPSGLRHTAVEVGLNDDQVQLTVATTLPSTRAKENDFRVRGDLG
jgi:hypothetical protein